MTIIQLKYVLAVAEHQNFTVAAEKSFVTQPTLSMQIQKLEKELDIEIFDRSAHPIKLTPIGELVVEQAKVILAESKKVKNLVEEEKGNLSGDFTVGVIPTVLPSLVPLFLKTFNQKHPNTNLIIKELKTAQLIDCLKQGNIDFGIAVTPLDQDQIVEKTLYYEPMVGYAPDSAIKAKGVFEESDLESEDILLLSEGNCFRNNVLNLCGKSSKTSENLNLDSGNFSTLVKLSDDGFGITILPSLFAEDLTLVQKENIVAFKEPVPTREVSLIYHQSQLRETFRNELIKVIQGVLRGKIFLESDNVSLPTLTVPKK